MNKLLKIAVSGAAALMFSSAIISPSIFSSNQTYIAQAKSKKKHYKYSKKEKTINKDISKTLKENQGFANGTLDENGKPTSNGKKNSHFDYTTNVNKIDYRTKYANIKVNPQFKSMSDSQKSAYAKKLQNMIASAINENESEPTYKVKKIALHFSNNNHSIGGSTKKHPTKFSWK